jgi:hypothetical protein
MYAVAFIKVPLIETIKGEEPRKGSLVYVLLAASHHRAARRRGSHTMSITQLSKHDQLRQYSLTDALGSQGCHNQEPPCLYRVGDRAMGQRPHN